MGTIKFGVPGMVTDIPAPLVGMNFDASRDATEMKLDSGGRSVYTAPTSFKHFKLSWSAYDTALRTVLDMYRGVYGTQAFYMEDKTADPVNVLPARWGSAWQLGYLAGGWCLPQIAIGSGGPHTRKVTFTQGAGNSSTMTSGVVRTRILRLPTQAYYFSTDLTSTGNAGVIVRGFNSSTNTWSVINTYTSAQTNTVVVPASDTTTTFIELDLTMPLNSTLTMSALVLGYAPRWTTLRKNLATNPSFETAGVTFTVRTNLVQNPLCSSGWSGRWFGGGSGAGTYTYPTGPTAVSPNGSYVRKTWTVVGSMNGDTGFHESNNALYSPVTPGQVVSFSAYLRPSVGDKIGQASLQFYASDRTTNVGSRYYGANTTLPANQWTRISQANVTVPSGAAYVQVIPDIGGAGALWAVNDTLDLSGPLLEVLPVVAPYIDGTNAPVLRANLALDPEGTATTNWVGMGNGATSTALDSTTFHTGTTSIKGTCSAVGGGVIGLASKVLNTGFVTGDTIVWSMWVNPSITLTAQPYWERETGAYAAGNGGGGINCPANTWTLVSGTYTFTAGQANPGDTFHFGFITGSVPQNTTVNADTVLVERNAPSGGSYFNGSTATASGLGYRWSGPTNGSASYQYDADYTYAWSGTSNASSSYQQAVSFSGGGGLVATLCASFQSTQWSNSRGKSVRIIALSSSTDTFAEIGGMFSGYTFQPNTTYTLSAVRYVSAPLTGASGTLARANIGSELAVTTIQAPPSTGSGRMVVQFTTGSNTTLNFIRLYSAAPYGGGDVWFDDLVLEQGAVSAANATYFDGTTAANTASGIYYIWDGNADASTSEQVSAEISPSLYPSGTGCGALQFTQNMSGTFKKVGWYGMTVDVEEIENGEGMRAIA